MDQRFESRFVPKFVKPQVLRVNINLTLRLNSPTELSETLSLLRCTAPTVWTRQEFASRLASDSSSSGSSFAEETVARSDTELNESSWNRFLTFFDIILNHLAVSLNLTVIINAQNWKIHFEDHDKTAAKLMSRLGI